MADAANAAKIAADRPMLNYDVYYAIVGADGDFVVGGDVARLDFRRDLRRVEAPTLIIAGRFDRVSMPKYTLRLKAYMPQAEFVMFERSGHYPFIEEPQKHFRLLRRFLSR